ncbi:DUF7482 domain-containing protein [Streptomyces gobiensis]|uniref:DUF7482 domain-containing protein n=1 Tax=Streptomyces gobiensis TaxID=2875706 RepID=UPI001E581984|nr:hypothetical protein [Streptomyces gobiensis]UGY91255.1 hypothetical protein test1122_05670 [Streptomyces gobiensis]
MSHGSWLNTRMDGRPVKAWIAIAVAIAVVVLGFGAWWTYGLNGGPDMREGMDGGGAVADAPRFPPVAGLYDGEQIAFAHTEASDPQVAEMLTDMMDSPVLVVPELADAPDATLGTVYVFTNGIKPDGPRGPMGYQPDVFDTAPGDKGYTPLREVHLVTWKDPAQARLLDSAGKVEQARSQRALQVKQTGAVVNMPFLQWPDGKR